MKAALKRRAYREAAAWLHSNTDAYDLPADLSEQEEDEMRTFIRHEIVAMLAKRGAEPKKT